MSDESNHSKSLEELLYSSEELESEEVEQSLYMAQETSEIIAEKREAESEFLTALKEFHAEQEQLLQQADSMLPDQCPKCESYIHSKKDKGSMVKNSECFTCFTAEQSKKVMEAEDMVEIKKMDAISTMDLSDYEEWLFDDELGRRSLSRILAKFKAQGYDYKPWQISIGASAWSKDNFNNTSLEDTRYLVERAKIQNIVDYIPESPDGIDKVITTLKQAEGKLESLTSKEKKELPIAMLGGIAGLSVLVPYLMRKRAR